MRAWVNLRYTVPKRRAIVHSGIKKHGFKPVDALPTYNQIKPNDIFLTWNRIGAANNVAIEFERRGQTVLVMENASFGNDFNGGSWYHMARNLHNTAGKFSYLGPERWNSLNVELSQFRTAGETVILPQRGIGSKPVAMPSGWEKRAYAQYGGRVRRHPGRRQGVLIEEDLKNCGRVVTWGSGAAIKALMMGIPVTSEMPNWIGEQDNTEQGRLEMFQRLIWAQWTREEIGSGFAFDCLFA